MFATTIPQRVRLFIRRGAEGTDERFYLFIRRARKTDSNENELHQQLIPLLVYNVVRVYSIIKKKKYKNVFRFQVKY